MPNNLLFENQSQPWIPKVEMRTKLNVLISGYFKGKLHKSVISRLMSSLADNSLLEKRMLARPTEAAKWSSVQIKGSADLSPTRLKSNFTIIHLSRLNLRIVTVIPE